MNYHPDFIWTALKMLTALGILLGVLILALYVSKRIFKGVGNQSRAKLIRVLASAYVGVKKNISLVEVPGSILVLGISGDRINLLAKIEDSELIRKITEDEKSSESFSSHLQKLSSRYTRNKDM